jgi:hypothetical protein
MTRIRVTTLLLCAVLVVGVAACSSSDDKGGEATTTTANKGFEVTTPQGQVSISLSGKLPPNWPDDFPLPQGSEPAGTGSLGNSSATGFIGVFTTSESPQDAYNFYNDNSELQVTSSSSLGSGNAYVGYVAFSGSFDGWVATAPYTNGQTLIIAYLNEPATDSTGTTGTTGSASDTGANP